ncbi:type II secretion system protein [bacterium]|nr:type II secretion system protein [bacterium]
MRNFKQGFTQPSRVATGVNGTIKGLFPSLAGKCRLGLLPQHIKFPSPIAGEGRISMRKLSIRNSGEGATHTNTPPQKGLPSLAREGLRVGLFPVRGKAAFTLAEVLITLAIIGVVAAMTLPTLIAKINEKADSNQKAVIEAKLIQGLNM